jgi:hypothetical protein
MGLLLAPMLAAGGLVGFYPLDGSLADASGNHNDGTAGATPLAFGPGASGFAGDLGAVFTGTDASQAFALPIDLNSYDQVTFGAWIKPAANGPIAGILGNDSGALGREIDLDDRAGSEGYSAFTGNGVVGAVDPTGGFDFVAVVYNKTTGTDTLYVNNRKLTTTGTPPAGNAFITVGDDAGTGSAYAGTIDDIFVFDTALSDQSIAALRAQGIATPSSAVPLPSAAAMVGSVIAGLVLRRVLRPLAGSASRITFG